jgi:hypothetical protein
MENTTVMKYSVDVQDWELEIGQALKRKKQSTAFFAAF